MVKWNLLLPHLFISSGEWIYAPVHPFTTIYYRWLSFTRGREIEGPWSDKTPFHCPDWVRTVQRGLDPRLLTFGTLSSEFECEHSPYTWNNRANTLCTINHIFQTYPTPYDYRKQWMSALSSPLFEFCLSSAAKPSYRKPILAWSGWLEASSRCVCISHIASFLVRPIARVTISTISPSRSEKELKVLTSSSFMSETVGSIDNPG